MAACEEVRPGRKDRNGATITDEIIDLKYSRFSNRDCLKEVTDCFIRGDLSLNEIIREEVPNSPVRRGRRGSFNGEFNEAKPRNPDRMKTVKDVVNFSSLKIMKSEMKIKMKGISVLTEG